MPRCFAPVFLLVGAALVAIAAEPEADPNELPRHPPRAPEEALATFAITKGFGLELAAAEPLVVDPVDLAFDESGHLFVVEMRGYPEQRDEKLGRVRRLTDLDGDGRFDRSEVFAEDLAWPTSVACWNGGVFVLATPELLFLRDRDGDGRADERKVVFTGFGSHTRRLNVQALPNSLRWSLDGRLFGATARNGGVVNTINLRTADFSFDPRRNDLRAETGTAQFGLSFDAAGRRFVCSNSRHLMQVVAERDNFASSPWINPPGRTPIIATDGPAAEVYRRSPDEPWRIVRTRWRVGGLVPGPVEGGGRVSGYFTAATGVTAYRGNAYPKTARRDVFIADAGSNLVHRKRLQGGGWQLSASRPAGEEKREFLSSTDNWFRPVQFAHGPDGCLYIADMYREVIEHPWSLPPGLKKHLDLSSGNDRGRIYRIVPDRFEAPPPPRFVSLEERLSALDHPNDWHRETAARLLLAEPDAKAGPELLRLLRTGSPPGRLRALLVLQGLDLLETEPVRLGLRDDSPLVREHAIRLSPRVDAAGIAAELVRVAERKDSTVRERVRLPGALKEVPPDLRLRILTRLLADPPRDPWIDHAVLAAVADGAEAVRLFESATGASPLARNELARITGRAADPVGLQQSLALAAAEAPELVEPLLAGWSASGRELKSLETAMIPRLRRAEVALANEQLEPAERMAALRLLGLFPTDSRQNAFLGLIGSPAPEALQLEAIALLERLRSEQVAGGVITHWQKLTLRVRTASLEAVLSRGTGARAVLDAVAAGRFPADALDSNRRHQLRTHADAAVRKRAATALPPPAGAVDPADYKEALRLTGNPGKGALLFRARCAACHRDRDRDRDPDPAAGGIGPDRVAFQAKGKDVLLQNILNPNAEVAPEFSAFQAVQKNGDTILGFLVRDSGREVTLRRLDGREITRLRSELASLESLGRSLMPEGLHLGWSNQNLADLLAFLVAPK